MPVSAPLAGRHVLVSAGPTYEDIDPVRFLGNRSSGKMGFAVAFAAAALGARVTLVAGPVHLPTPPQVLRIDVRSAAQMQAAVMAALPVDAYIGAAAVADYAPQVMAPGKLKKNAQTLQLALVRTPDILAGVAAHPARPAVVVGFAAETDDVATYARGKLQAKRVDLIAANRVGVAGTGFEGDDNALVVYAADGSAIDLGSASKQALAARLVQMVADRLTHAAR